MGRRWRQRLADPNAQSRLAWVLLLAAAVIVFVATWWRSSTAAGSVGRSATYLLDVAAIFVALTSTVVEGRLANLLGDFPLPSLRRGSALRFLGGFLIALLGCLLGAVIGDDHLPRVIVALGIGFLAAGLTLMLNGSVRLTLVEGGRYAANKIQERLDDDY